MQSSKSTLDTYSRLVNHWPCVDIHVALLNQIVIHILHNVNAIGKHFCKFLLVGIYCMAKRRRLDVFKVAQVTMSKAWLGKEFTGSKLFDLKLYLAYLPS